jgi:hypothetical protein
MLNIASHIQNYDRVSNKGTEESYSNELQCKKLHNTYKKSYVSAAIRSHYNSENIEIREYNTDKWGISECGLLINKIQNCTNHKVCTT